MVVIMRSIILSTYVVLPFGSFKGLSMIIIIVEIMMISMMKGSKYGWSTILEQIVLKKFFGPKRRSEYP